MKNPKPDIPSTKNEAGTTANPEADISQDRGAPDDPHNAPESGDKPEAMVDEVQRKSEVSGEK